MFSEALVYLQVATADYRNLLGSRYTNIQSKPRISDVLTIGRAAQQAVDEMHDLGGNSHHLHVGHGRLPGICETATMKPLNGGWGKAVDQLTLDRETKPMLIPKVTGCV